MSLLTTLEPQVSQVVTVGNTAPLQFVPLLNKLTQLYRAYTLALLQDIDVYPGQDRVICVLSSQPLGMVEVARRLDVRAQTLSKTVNRLSAQGLVQRRGDIRDQRRVYLHLTETGLALQEKIFECWNKLESELKRELKREVSAHSLLQDLQALKHVTARVESRLSRIR